MSTTADAGTKSTQIELATIKKTEYPAAQLWPSIITRTGGLGEIAERISLVDPEHDVEAKNANRWLTARPEPRNAWNIGEALRFRDENLQALLRCSSGLLALYWFGHLDDFIGVLGCCAVNELVAFEPRLMAMLRTMRASTYASPYDALPFDHPIFMQSADEFSLRQISDTKIVSTPVDFSFKKEATFLNFRRLAFSVWEMPDGLHAMLQVAARKWLNEPNGNGGEILNL